MSEPEGAMSLEDVMESLQEMVAAPGIPSRADVLQALRWKKFPVLDDGFVTLVDVMGDDYAVVQAARVSFGQDLRDFVQEYADNPDCMTREAFLQEKQVRTERAQADDRRLLRYLMRQQHATPFEMVEVKLLIRLPMDCNRQWIRHRTANVNEYSTRYAPAIDAAAHTHPQAWRKQATANKQGSDGGISDWPAGYAVVPLASDGDFLLPSALLEEERATHVGWAVTFTDAETGETEHLASFPGDTLDRVTPGYYLTVRETGVLSDTRDVYEERLKFQVAKEQARKDLPLSTYTELYWKCDLRNIFNFLRLRMDSHAQQEIREYATLIGEQIIQPLFPECWQAFVDYQLEALTLTRLEQEVLQRLVSTRAGEMLSRVVTKFTAYLEQVVTGGSNEAHPEPPRVNYKFSEEDFRTVQDPSWVGLAKCTERDECRAKLQRLQLLE